MSRSLAALLSAFVLLPAFPDAAFGQGVPGPVSGFVSVATPSNFRGGNEEDPPPIQDSRQVEGTASAILSADYTRSRNGETVSTSTNTIAMAEVFGGMRPQAIATAASVADTDRDSSVIIDEARASALLDYEVSIAQRAEPPIVFHPPLRLFADVRVEVSYEGAPKNQATTSARVNVANSSRLRFFQRQMSVRIREPGVESESAQWGFTALPGDIIRVSLQARAESGIRPANSTRGEPAILESEAIAVADPLFTFDQAGFDAAMAAEGLPTFRVEDFYDIVYSPTLLESLPRLFQDGFEAPPAAAR